MKTTQRVLLAITMAATSTGMPAGCRSPKEPIPTRTLTEFKGRASVNGLEIAIEAWIQPDGVKRHFGIDLLSRRIVPFEVMFANLAREGGFQLQPESAVILDKSALRRIQAAPSYGIQPSGADTAVLLVTHWAISQIAALIYAVAREDAYQDEREIQEHLEDVGFNDRPLYRSESKSGFLYLEMADMADLHRAGAIQFQIKNIQSGQEETVVVPLRAR